MAAEDIKARYLNEPDPDTPEKALLRKELREIIEKKLSRLAPQEQAILEMHYGLRGKPEMTLAEIVDHGGLELTIGQIAHIEKRALKKVAALAPKFRRAKRSEILSVLDK